MCLMQHYSVLQANAAHMIKMVGWRPRVFEDQIFVLFAEDDSTHDASAMTVGERLLNYIIRVAQPEPSFSHCELVFFDTFASALDAHSVQTHFSTYIGQNAQYQQCNDYYLGGGPKWRALPVFDRHGLQRSVRETCNSMIGVDYSLASYVFAWRPVRRLRELLFFKDVADVSAVRARQPAQCASLVARVLQFACQDRRLAPRADFCYGPSTLYRTLGRHAVANSRSTSARDSRRTVEEELQATSTRVFDAISYEELLKNRDSLKLLTLPDAELLERCTEAEAQKEIATIVDVVLTALHNDDPTQSARAERDLARALLRWSHVVQTKARRLQTK